MKKLFYPLRSLASGTSLLGSKLRSLPRNLGERHCPRVYIILLTFFLFLGSALWLTSCGSGGTETKNPTTTGEDDGDDGVVSDTGRTLASDQILDALCAKLVECFENLELADCETGVGESSDVHAEIGFEEDDYDTFSEVIDDEDAENVSASADSLTSCLADIEALECSDSSVQSAFNKNDADNFNNIGRMIPDGEDSCEGVF